MSLLLYSAGSPPRGARRSYKAMALPRLPGLPLVVTLGLISLATTAWMLCLILRLAHDVVALRPYHYPAGIGHADPLLQVSGPAAAVGLIFVTRSLDSPRSLDFSRMARMASRDSSFVGSIARTRCSCTSRSSVFRAGPWRRGPPGRRRRPPTPGSPRSRARGPCRRRSSSRDSP